MKKQIKVPFWKDTGNHCVYPYSQTNLVEVDNYEFTTILIYSGYKQSRAGLHVKWIDETGKEYISSEMLLDQVLSGQYPFERTEGRLSIYGTFTFKKQGTSIFLILKS